MYPNFTAFRAERQMAERWALGGILYDRHRAAKIAAAHRNPQRHFPGHPTNQRESKREQDQHQRGTQHSSPPDLDHATDVPRMSTSASHFFDVEASDVHGFTLWACGKYDEFHKVEEREQSERHPQECAICREQVETRKADG